MRITSTLFLITIFIGACASDGRGGPRGERDAGPRPGSDAGPMGGDDAGPSGDDAGPAETDTGPTCTPLEETCNGADDDCDSNVDEEVAAPSCELTLGVCMGAVATCGGELGFGACGATEYGADFEMTEVRCDALDNDCDGMTDEGCVCSPGMTRPCGSDTGECTAGTQTCTPDATWSACAGEVGPMGESCNGRDDDCDGSTDETGDLMPPACPLQEGVCAGSRRACGGAGGFSPCGASSYGSDFEATETRCDALDNDCDGVTDEGCACVTGDTQPCGSDVGACMTGVQTCTLGGWGACAGEIAPVAESCNGLDDDCDGPSDEGVIGPLCPLQAGVCSGSRQRCAGAAGFAACGATEYGSRYQAAETTCDGQDNDCDGIVDEGCPCVVGAVQSCGSSVGICRPGTQTCSASGWGACSGGVTPGTESCNGLDDDCNGSTDDGLTAPSCALTMGVCAGTTQVCGGAAGWMACSGPGSYGARYAADEAGATREELCDGLDNDCDGSADEGCLSAPLINSAADEYDVSVYDRMISYIAGSGTTSDVYVWDARTVTSQRLTTTAAIESQTDIYGNVVVFQRGEDAAARIVMYDLVSGTERVLTSARAESPRIFRNYVIWSDRRGADYDVYLYDIAGAREYAYVTGAGDQIAGDIRGPWLVYYALEGATTYRVHYVDIATGVDRVQNAASGHQLDPIADWLAFAWTDARGLTRFDDPLLDTSIQGASFAMPSTATTEVSAPRWQRPTGMDGLLMVWNDYRDGDWDVGFKTYGDAGTTLITTGPAVQAGPAIHGANVIWTDNRAGNFDVFTTFITGHGVAAAGQVRINEILADPAVGADVNGDGLADASQDEFVELVNTTGVALDISGFTLSDSVGLRHTFGAQTYIPAAGSIVVFGGGMPRGRFGGVQVLTASGGMLGLNNTGDTVTLRAADGTTVIDAHTYAGEAGMDASIVRNPEYDGAFARHDTVMGALGRQSPGTLAYGYSF